MKKENDAYGQELWDYYKGETGHPELVERDDGLFDYMFLSKKEIEELIKSTGWVLSKFDLQKKSNSYIAVLEKLK